MAYSCEFNGNLNLNQTIKKFQTIDFYYLSESLEIFRNLFFTV